VLIVGEPNACFDGQRHHRHRDLDVAGPSGGGQHARTDGNERIDRWSSHVDRSRCYLDCRGSYSGLDCSCGHVDRAGGYLNRIGVYAGFHCSGCYLDRCGGHLNCCGRYVNYRGSYFNSRGGHHGYTNDTANWHRDYSPGDTDSGRLNADPDFGQADNAYLGSDLDALAFRPDDHSHASYAANYPRDWRGWNVCL
jgi:hypothetical protein